MDKLLESMKRDFESFMTSANLFLEQVHKQSEVIEEDDYTLDWDDFKQKHPDIPKEEYEAGVKAIQEM